jgi:hypothetical protein
MLRLECYSDKQGRRWFISARMLENRAPGNTNLSFDGFAAPGRPRENRQRPGYLLFWYFLIQYYSDVPISGAFLDPTQVLNIRDHYTRVFVSLSTNELGERHGRFQSRA